MWPPGGSRTSLAGSQIYVPWKGVGAARKTEQKRHLPETASCCYSVAKLCLTLCNSMTAAHQASLSLTISWTLPKFMSIELVMLSNCLILCHTLLLLPSIFANIRVSSSESALCIRWPKFCSSRISPSSEYSRLMFFQIDWFDLFAVQGTLKTLL